MTDQNNPPAPVAGDTGADAVPAETGYVECRQCDRCNHAGINDSPGEKAACHHCDWTGDAPEQDKCPGCGEENCMAAACPKCGGIYRLFAESRIASPCLDKPAMVGGGRFGVGVKWSTVIGAAQRLYEYEVTPSKEADRIKRAKESLSELRQAIGASMAYPQWEPIETAPKNGMTVLVAHPTKQIFTDVPVMIRTAYWDGWFWRGENGSILTGDYKPTHWMQIPTPPVPYTATQEAPQ